MVLDRASLGGRERRSRTSFVVLLLLVVATTSWRRGVFFDGGLDPVVAGKALVSLMALSIASVARLAQPRPLPVGGRSFWLMATYVTVAAFGGFAADQFLPAAVLSVRMFILGMTLVLLVGTYPAEQLVRDLFTAMLLVGGVAALTGLGSLESGRLFGGVPPLHPNEIAMLLGLPLLGLTWLGLHNRVTARHLALAVACLTLIWLTGSRTGLLAVVAGIALMVVQARRLGPVAASVVAVTIPVSVYLLFASNAVLTFVSRGGEGNLATVSSRMIAWRAAWSFPESEWARWVGSGLSQKLIPVRGQWWDTQLLDSTWVSALVQTGYVGVVILIIWLCSALVASLQAPWQARMLLTGVLFYLVLRSVLESGLLDSTVPFLVLMLVSLLSDRWTRQGWERSFDQTRGPHRSRLVASSSLR